MGPKGKHHKEIQVGDYKSDEPFTIIFAYPEDGPIVIKGSERETLNYVNKKLGICHYQITYWCKGKTLEEWRVNGSGNWRITTTLKKAKKYHVFEYKRRPILEFRTIPKKFLLFLQEIENSNTSEKEDKT